jgi:uncharacterized RDD family membrane protein YckC
MIDVKEELKILVIAAFNCIGAIAIGVVVTLLLTLFGTFCMKITGVHPIFTYLGIIFFLFYFITRFSRKRLA